MEQYLIYFIILPFVALFLSFIPHRDDEKKIYYISLISIGFQLIGTIIFSVVWLIHHREPIFYKLFIFPQKSQNDPSFDLYFDGLTMTYAIIGTILGVLVIIFSRYYMHRDKGYKRFFNNILFFYLGLNCVVFSGNFETLFVGWEILGITSFFLIGFYRLRYLPVKNAMKVLTLYRLSDVCLLLAVWFCHLAFGRSITFFELNNSHELATILSQQHVYFYLIPFSISMVAAIKSAQLPFSTWLPRAMEGPTTSTAIFYGALSVHIGIFLMVRIAPLWDDNTIFRAIVFTLGLASSLIATSIASVQPTVKTQIAYSSIAQIGLMFVEISLGFYTLAMFHFAGNALLRTYQLLVSPSVLNYMIHDQYYNFEKPKDKTWFNPLHNLRSTIFVLSIKEWNLDYFQFKILWLPFKFLGNTLRFFLKKYSFYVIAVIIVASYIGFYGGFIPFLENVAKSISIILAFLAFCTILIAFTERERAKRAWMLIILTQLLIVGAVAYNGSIDYVESVIYLSGVILAGPLGFYCLYRIEKLENVIDINGFKGHIYEHPILGLTFLLAGLGLADFPITPAFLGLDIIFLNIHEGQYLLPALLAVTLIFMEIAAIRLYVRIFLGPHVKQYHAIAFRSS